MDYKIVEINGVKYGLDEKTNSYFALPEKEVKEAKKETK